MGEKDPTIGKLLPYEEPVPFHPYTPRVVYVLPRSLLQEGFRVLRLVRIRLEIGAPHARAIHGVVNAVVLPQGPQDPVLDVVQAHLLSLDRHQFRPPGATAEKPRRDLDVPDALHRG